MGKEEMVTTCFRLLVVKKLSQFIPINSRLSGDCTKKF